MKKLDITRWKRPRVLVPKFLLLIATFPADIVQTFASDPAHHKVQKFDKIDPSAYTLDSKNLLYSKYGSMAAKNLEAQQGAVESVQSSEINHKLEDLALKQDQTSQLMSVKNSVEVTGDPVSYLKTPALVQAYLNNIPTSGYELIVVGGLDTSPEDDAIITSSKFINTELQSFSDNSGIHATFLDIHNGPNKRKTDRRKSQGMIEDVLERYGVNEVSKNQATVILLKDGKNIYSEIGTNTAMESNGRESYMMQAIRTADRNFKKPEVITPDFLTSVSLNGLAGYGLTTEIVGDAIYIKHAGGEALVRLTADVKAAGTGTAKINLVDPATGALNTIEYTITITGNKGHIQLTNLSDAADAAQAKKDAAEQAKKDAAEKAEKKKISEELMEQNDLQEVMTTINDLNTKIRALNKDIINLEGVLGMTATVILPIDGTQTVTPITVTEMETLSTADLLLKIQAIRMIEKTLNDTVKAKEKYLKKLKKEKIDIDEETANEEAAAKVRNIEQDRYVGFVTLAETVTVGGKKVSRINSAVEPYGPVQQRLYVLRSNKTIPLKGRAGLGLGNSVKINTTFRGNDLTGLDVGSKGFDPNFVTINDLSTKDHINHSNGMLLKRRVDTTNYAEPTLEFYREKKK